MSSGLNGAEIKLKPTQQIVLEGHQDADHAKIINRRRSVLGIIHSLFGVAVCWKVQIQPAIESESTDGEIRRMYKDVKKTKIYGSFSTPHRCTYSTLGI